MTHISDEVRDGVAIVTLTRPPVNSLDLATRRELLAATKRALADASVEAIVLTGSATAFSAGADIKEFAAGLQGNAMKESGLQECVNLFETSAKPAVAAIAGVCMGGGLELALGCHHRLVAKNARLDLAGGDIGWAIRKRRAVEQPDRPYSKLPDRICELGRFGQTTGSGWYRYEKGNRTRQQDPVVERIVEEHRRDTGLARRQISPDEMEFRRGYQGQFWEPAPLLKQHAQRRAPLTALSGEEGAR